MPKFLKNYTSNVPTSQTIYRIEQVLIKCGVSGIMKLYGLKGEITAITFQIQVSPDHPPTTIKMPVNVNQALQALWLNYADGDKLTSDGSRLQWNARKKLTREHFREQAERTAWKIMQDWIEVQMSMIQMQQADFREVFLPYVWDGKQTLFERVKEAGYKALLPASTEQARQ